MVNTDDIDVRPNNWTFTDMLSVLPLQHAQNKQSHSAYNGWLGNWETR
jgi:hypothetical protein